jgi:hypothetical protein
VGDVGVLEKHSQYNERKNGENILAFEKLLHIFLGFREEPNCISYVVGQPLEEQHRNAQNPAVPIGPPNVLKSFK